MVSHKIFQSRAGVAGSVGNNAARGTGRDESGFAVAFLASLSASLTATVFACQHSVTGTVETPVSTTQEMGSLNPQLLASLDDYARHAKDQSIEMWLTTGSPVCPPTPPNVSTCGDDTDNMSILSVSPAWPIFIKYNSRSLVTMLDDLMTARELKRVLYNRSSPLGTSASIKCHTKTPAGRSYHQSMP